MGFNTTWASLGAAQWLGRANSFTYFLPSHSRHSHREVVKALKWIYGCLDIQIILWNFSIFTFPRRTFAGKKGIFFSKYWSHFKCEMWKKTIEDFSTKWAVRAVWDVGSLAENWDFPHGNLLTKYRWRTDRRGPVRLLTTPSPHLPSHYTSLCSLSLLSSVQWEGSSWLLSTVNSHIFLPVSDISLHHFLSSPRSWSTRIRLSSINLNKILTTI